MKGYDAPPATTYAALKPGTVKSATTGETLFSNAPDAAPVGMLPALANTSERRGITAFHGSPHDFDKFDAAHIGKGEGAQAYGHGLYFAENEGVARSYRDALSDPLKTGNNKHIDGAGQRLVDDLLAKHGGDVSTAAAEARARAADASIDIVDRRVAELAAGKLVPPGKMYEVRLNAEPEQFLDWDKPLSQQSEEVRKALEPLGLAGDKSVFDAMNEGVARRVGKDAKTEGDFKRGEAEAAAALRDSGIAGIRYLDGMSRDKGEGSVNYVVFPGNENLIDIVRKYANPPDAAPAGLLATDPEDDDLPPIVRSLLRHRQY
jgi:hypothetical protein